MSTRIHELAKKHNMEGRDMLALLKERGYVAADTKSVSSTVSKIYIEEIEKEFALKAQAAPAAQPVVPAVPAAPEAPAADHSKSRSPVGIFVKSAQDVAREREAVAVAKAGIPPRPAMPPAKAPAPPPPRPATPPRMARVQGSPGHFAAQAGLASLRPCG
jgi:translation initiation factor IF-2